MKLTALIACEYSGIVRDAFENAGWDAWSCDLLPTESEQTAAAGKHFEGDILEFLYTRDRALTNRIPRKFPFTESIDLLIGHPPCTYLSFAYTGERRYEQNRLLKTVDAIKFFVNLWNAPIEHICLENPCGTIQYILPYSQIVHPYYFGKENGEDYTKRTCLWLKNLPLLQYSKEDTLFETSNYVKPSRLFYNASNRKSTKNTVCKSFSSGKERSKFHKGIAKAMAEQWRNNGRSI